MTKEDIVTLIEKDEWMMKILNLAEKLNLSNWVIGAGFIRNKIWDHLHGYTNKKVDTKDIDLVYFDPINNSISFDKELSDRLQKETGMQWEIVNEAFAHNWNNSSPYKSIEDALSQWPETATGIGVKLQKGKLILITPYGIDDLVNLIIRPSPKFKGGIDVVKKRVQDKGWLGKFPKLSSIINMKPIFIAIAGGSGAGKSTLCSLLLDKYSEKMGMIQLDDYFKSISLCNR